MRTRRRLLGGLAAGGVAALAARAAYTGGDRLPAHVRDPFDRLNHAGRPVTLLEGPAYVVGAGAGALLSGAPATVAVVGAGAFGALDDLRGDGASKGLRGHLGAAARGEVTTGLVKIVGLGASGFASSWLSARRDGHRGAPALSRGLLGGAVVAGSANLVNLLDLRPGRALKVTVLTALPLVCARPGAARAAGAALGAAAALLPADLRGEAMLGDTGANAAGALVGTAFVEATGPRSQAAALAVLVGLTLASERVSFTRVIEATPVLRQLDRLGRPAS